MTPREIIAEAWAITKKEKKIRRWGFASSFLETLLNVKLLGYQAYFAYAAYTGEEVGFFDDFIWLYNSGIPLWAFVSILVGFGFLLLMEFFVPHLCQGAIIGLAAKAYKGEPLRGGLVFALHNFFGILASHELFVMSGWATAVTSISLIFRYIEGTIKYPAIIGVLIIFSVSNILKFFASFSDEGIVIQKRGIFSAITQSYKLLISHLTRIMFLLILLFAISLRILLNALMVLLIPTFIVGFALLFATFLSQWLSYLLAGILGIILILGASYFFAYLHVFKQTVWTLAYLSLVSKKDLDVIDI